jgi:aspartyl-tRNA(Asn)/glutamyl-tRNA(Gln) amidotransferase subunit C
MAVTKEDIRYITKLARINMSEEELEKFTSQVDKILEYINKLNELDTRNVEPLTHIVNLKNVMREDKVTGESLKTEEALSLAPEKEKDFFKVPKVIE